MAAIQARLEAMRQWLDTDRRCQWPEQKRYEVLRTVVLYGQSPTERALETGVPRSSLYDRVKRFRQVGMISHIRYPSRECRGHALSTATNTALLTAPSTEQGGA